MRRSLAQITILCVASVVLCNACSRSSTSVPDKVSPVTSMDPWVNDSAALVLEVRGDVLELIENEDFAAAEALVDEHLGDPAYGVFMPLRKAELLANRGATGDSLDLYLEVMNGVHGLWVPTFDDLSAAFQQAVSLDRWIDADNIATLLLQHQRVEFHEHESLQIPTVSTDSDERLAFALLAIGLDAGMAFEGDAVSANEKRVQLCLSARDAIAASPLVHVHLAGAYHDRGNAGDQTLCRAALIQAYSLAQGESELQAEIQLLGQIYRVAPIP